MAPGGSAAGASEKSPILGAPNPTVPRRAGRRGAGRPTHRGGANTSFLALLAALSAMAAMFAVVTRIPPMTPGAVPFSPIPALSGGRRALSRPKIGPETFPDDPRARRGAVTYDAFNDAKSGAPAIELVWQRPRRPEGAAPKGIVFLAHGCHHAAVDFFPASDRCVRCAGLPEEARVAAKALTRGYVVAAVSSEKACWNTQGDARRVAAALDRVRRRNPDLPRGAPVFAFGASSGGAFVAALPFFADVDGVVAQIAGVGFPRDPRSNTAFFATPAELGDALREARGGADAKATPGENARARGEATSATSSATSSEAEARRDGGGENGDVARDREVAYPPVVFSHMSRDALVGALVDESRAFLDAAGVPTRVTELAPQPVDANFFHRRVVRAADAEGDGEKGPGATEPAIRVADSAAMAAALREGGLLDSEGYLKRDPRASEWRDALRRKGAAPRFDALVPDQSATAEALNVAFAAHELSSDKFDEDVRWLEERAAERRGEAPGAVAGAQTDLDAVKADAGETGGGAEPVARVVVAAATTTTTTTDAR
jgi:hypothetical protein